MWSRGSPASSRTSRQTACNRSGVRVAGNNRAAPSARGSAATSLTASGRNQSVRGPVFESSSRTLTPASPRLPGVVPRKVEDFRQARAGERQQTNRRLRHRVRRPVPVEGAAAAFQFLMAEEARDGPARDGANPPELQPNNRVAPSMSQGRTFRPPGGAAASLKGSG